MLALVAHTSLAWNYRTLLEKGIGCVCIEGDLASGPRRAPGRGMALTEHGAYDNVKHWRSAAQCPQCGRQAAGPWWKQDLHGG